MKNILLAIFLIFVYQTALSDSGIIVNKGQWPDNIKFGINRQGLKLWSDGQSLIIDRKNGSAKADRISIEFPESEFTGIMPFDSIAYVNYFIGERSDWRTHVPVYKY
ncbi:MAG: hypothetical protein ACOCX7_02960, partial [Bacteroidota bacterium]